MNVHSTENENTRWLYFLTNLGIPVKALMEMDAAGTWLGCTEARVPNSKTGKLELDLAMAGLVTNDCNQDNLITEKQFPEACREYLTWASDCKKWMVTTDQQGI